MMGRAASDDVGSGEPLSGSAYIPAGQSGQAAPASPTPHASAPKKQRNWARIVVTTVVAVIVCLVLVAVLLFSWNRWWRYDDAEDIQGTWLVHGTDTAIVIDESYIWITDDVGYAYTLDADSKTIEFSFGDMSGSGRYRFSSDRSQLIIVDGDGYTWTSTLGEDIGLAFDELAAAITGDELEEVEADDTTTVLDWESDDTTVEGAEDEEEAETEEAAEEEDSTEADDEADEADEADAASDADADADVAESSDLADAETSTDEAADDSSSSAEAL